MASEWAFRQRAIHSRWPGIKALIRLLEALSG